MLRSIPAPAGEPHRRHSDLREPAVYPRACGGTYVVPAQPPLDVGLSPRLRGNHRPGGGRTFCQWSIPAPAGEPPGCRAIRAMRPVYPRACGGTVWRSSTTSATDGLSPRLRGNRRQSADVGAIGRSIPAPAGEPRARFVPKQLRWVYPRACGGTQTARIVKYQLLGLSPRLRGNREAQEDTATEQRSIPAPAGEPASPVRSTVAPGVYPRACGGTANACSSTACSCGLSPRLRGNLRLRVPDN